MNLVLFERDDERFLAAGTPTAEHLLRVLKISRGGTFWCGVKNGARGLATVRDISPEGGISFSVEWEKTSDTTADCGVPAASAFPPVRLLVGLSRPQTMKKIFAVAGELGCARIDVFQAESSDPAYAESSLWKNGDDTIGEILKKSAEQTCTTAIPPVRLHRSLSAFFAEENLRERRASDASFCESFPIALDVYEAEKSLSQLAFPHCGVPVLLAIGSERGWTAAERALFREKNFVFAHLGERVLRVETAVAAALVVALARTDSWRRHKPIA